MNSACLQGFYVYNARVWMEMRELLLENKRILLYGWKVFNAAGFLDYTSGTFFQK